MLNGACVVAYVSNCLHGAINRLLSQSPTQAMQCDAQLIELAQSSEGSALNQCELHVVKVPVPDSKVPFICEQADSVHVDTQLVQVPEPSKNAAL